MKPAPASLLQRVADSKFEVTAKNVWQALRYRAYVQILGPGGDVLAGNPSLDKVAGFRLTQRGRDALVSATSNVSALNRHDLPKEVSLWLSALRRCGRNCPKRIHLTHSGGQLRVLSEDASGGVKDDDAHRIASFKVPWL